MTSLKHLNDNNLKSKKIVWEKLWFNSNTDLEITP